MYILLAAIYMLSFAALAHSYVLYPFLLKRWESNKKGDNFSIVIPDEKLPQVSVIMPVYNEAAVIRTKLASLQALDYPPEKLQIYIGSDQSTDDTNAIVSEYAEKDNRYQLMAYSQRRGKPRVVNDLAAHAIGVHGKQPEHIFLLTDANVLPASDLLQHLIPHFVADEKIGLVDTHMRNPKRPSEGIPESEAQYIQREVHIKHREGKLWGCMMGPFGGCYALRSTYWKPVPHTHLVDDFYVNMETLRQGGKCINELKAIAYESTPAALKDEWKRKRRISAGNFQNLSVFRQSLWPIWKPIGFCFFSHKLLRWLGPLFIISMWISSAVLAFTGNKFFLLLFCLQTAFLLAIPLMEYFLKKLGIKNKFLRILNYFIWMNAALFSGLIKYLYGIRNNIWERTNRN